MELPILGKVIKDDSLGWIYSKEMFIPVLKSEHCRFVLEGYEEDPSQQDFIIAIKNFLALSDQALLAVQDELYQYYRDTVYLYGLQDGEYKPIRSANDVWSQVSLDVEPMVLRRAHGDQGVYISLSCACDWEPEHGLQIVFKNGEKVNKLGPFDGHLSNSDAYAKEALEDIIYHSPTGVDFG